jgi:S-adenosyl-L-methionine hydrolase (adenosine-forming)
MITLLTDFGTADYFVPAVKGIILMLNPRVQIVDLTHDIPAQDIRAGAFTLGACWHNFPPGTIHLAVVDPGVGSARRPIVVQADQHAFVGPDNGLFSFVYARAQQVSVFHATNADFFQPKPSATFHGRDVFAPLAGWLSRGVHPASFGPVINDHLRFDLPQPQFDPATSLLIGSVIHIDRFGNCITNLTERELPLEMALRLPSSALRIGDCVVQQVGTHFAQAAKQDELFAYLGSAGYWEVALWCASAAEKYGLIYGAKVTLTPGNASVPAR